MEENKEDKEDKEYKEIERNKFWNKYGFLVVIGGFTLFFIILKLIGFPDFLIK